MCLQKHLLVLSTLVLVNLMFQSLNTCRMRKWHHLQWEHWLLVEVEFGAFEVPLAALA